MGLISIAQYNKPINSSNYDYDDSHFLNDFLEDKNNKALQAGNNRAPLQSINSENVENLRQNVQSLPCVVQNLLPSEASPLNNIEKNALYRVAGYLINSIKKNSKTCDSCIASAGSRESSKFANVEFAKFVAWKEFQENLLFYVNEATFNFFQCADQIYRDWKPIVEKMKNINVFEFFSCRLEAIECDHILKCHNLRDKILRRFILFCLRINNKAKKKEKTEKKFNSKSMAMHTVFQ